MRPASVHHSSGISSRRARLRTIRCIPDQSSSPCDVRFADAVDPSRFRLRRSTPCSSSELPTESWPTQPCRGLRQRDKETDPSPSSAAATIRSSGDRCCLELGKIESELVPRSLEDVRTGPSAGMYTTRGARAGSRLGQSRLWGRLRYADAYGAASVSELSQPESHPGSTR